MKAHIIFIGGTGSCCAKAFLAAGGIGAATFVPENCQIKLHTIDPDTDGAAQRAVGNLRSALRDLQRIIPDAIPCSLETSGTQHRPYEGFGQLPDQVTVPNLMGCAPQTGGHRILQLLLDDYQIGRELRHGFYGWPGVGSAVWERWNPVELPGCEDFGSAAQGEAVRIILVGSIFGGTGSSGIPTLARRYRERIEKAQGRENIRLQALVLTPYFKVDPGDRPPEEALIREEDNKFRTRHVMEDIAAGNHGLDAVFYLGRKDVDQTQYPSDCYSLDAQKNPTTLIERIAAWTLWTTLLAPGTGPEAGGNYVFSISDGEGSLSSWDPEAGARFERAAARVTALVAMLGIELGQWAGANPLALALGAWLDLQFGGRKLDDGHLSMAQAEPLRQILAILEDPQHTLPKGVNWDQLFRQLTGNDRYAVMLKAAGGNGGLAGRIQEWIKRPESATKDLWNALNCNERIAHA